jgi:phenylalanine ammonia-lyase
MGDAFFCKNHFQPTEMGGGLSEYTQSVLFSFRDLEAVEKEAQPVHLDGHSLRLSDAVAVSKYYPSFVQQDAAQQY